jgi:hypothetical protein
MGIADVVAIIVIGGWLATVLGIGVCGNLLYDRCICEIQLDPRYLSDPQWRREADTAIFLKRADQFAVQAGFIGPLPRWYRIGRYAGCATFVLFVVLVGCVKLHFYLRR